MLQLQHVKYWEDGRAGWELELICHFVDLSDHLKWAKELETQLMIGSSSD